MKMTAQQRENRLIVANTPIQHPPYTTTWKETWTSVGSKLPPTVFLDKEAS